MLGPARGAVFLQGIWRKLTYALLMTIIIPVSAISIMALLILIAINPNAWRRHSQRAAGDATTDGGGAPSF
jgi:hypothetical protein